jgi:hypothetical protein
LADFVDNTVKDIDSRLGELKLEVKKLEAARAVLVGERRGPGRPPASSATPTKRTPPPPHKPPAAHASRTPPRTPWR